MATSLSYLDDENLLSLLATHKRNLALLEEQAAKLGSVNTPISTVNQIRETLEAIEAIHREMSLRQKPSGKHHLIYKFRNISRSGNTTYINHVQIPEGYLCVELSDYDHNGNDENGAAMDCSCYNTIAKVLDDLYIYYLHDRYKPYTYGSQWILSSCHRRAGRLLIPWGWLFSTNWNDYQLDRSWAILTSLEQLSMTPGTCWVVKQVPKIDVLGMAVNDSRLIRAIQRSPKAIYMLLNRGHIEIIDPILVDLNLYQSTVVVENKYHWMPNELKKVACLRQTEEPLDEELLQYWLD